MGNLDRKLTEEQIKQIEDILLTDEDLLTPSAKNALDRVQKTWNLREYIINAPAPEGLIGEDKNLAAIVRLLKRYILLDFEIIETNGETILELLERNGVGQSIFRSMQRQIVLDHEPNEEKLKRLINECYRKSMSLFDFKIVIQEEFPRIMGYIREIGPQNIKRIASVLYYMIPVYGLSALGCVDYLDDLVNQIALIQEQIDLLKTEILGNEELYNNLIAALERLEETYKVLTSEGTLL